MCDLFAKQTNANDTDDTFFSINTFANNYALVPVDAVA